MKELNHGTVLENKALQKDIYDLRIVLPEVAQAAMPGQFIQIYLADKAHILPRPISICDIEAGGVVRVVYQVVGEGTQILSHYQKGESLAVLGPLGNGFPWEPAGDAILAGGGIGIFPLFLLAKWLKDDKKNRTVSAFLGYRTAPFMVDEFKRLGISVDISTDDGSAGFHGNAVALMKQKNKSRGVLFACGPKIMLQNTALYAREQNLTCYVSMEERMACGLGACVGCVVPIKENNSWVYKKVCKDGPVFNAEEVVWRE